MAATEGIYRRVSVRLWSDEKVGRLSPMQPSGQALWLYLLTGPHTSLIPGVFVAGRAAIAEALGWEIEDFDRCVTELLNEGLVRFDRAARLWFIPKALRHNPPASPNVVTGWRTPWAMLPECPMREQIGEEIAATLEAFSKPCAEAFRKACGKPFDNPSPYPSPNQETGNRRQEAGERDAASDARPKARGVAIAPKTGRATRSPAAESGSRLPADWSLPSDWRIWAQQERPGLDPASTAERFADHWRAQPGAKGRKADWFATWRNWVRTERGLSAGNRGRASPLHADETFI